jgi:cytochrome c2
MADPSDTSYVPRPEWYFLFLFQSLKLFRGPLEPFASFGLPSLAVLILVLVPFLDRSSVQAWRNRIWAVAGCALVFAGWSALTMAALRDSPHDLTPSSTFAASQRVLTLAPDELAGFAYFRRGNCRNCHNLLEGDPKVGPTLATLSDRRAPEWTDSHIREESAAFTRTLTSAQMNALVQFVAKVNAKDALNLDQAPADLLAGADVFVRNLCVSCHKVNGAGGQTGPPLNSVRTRRSRKWVERHFENPKIMSPGTIMPAYHFSSEEREAIISYLFQLP